MTNINELLNRLEVIHEAEVEEAAAVIREQQAEIASLREQVEKALKRIMELEAQLNTITKDRDSLKKLAEIVGNHHAAKVVECQKLIDSLNEIVCHYQYKGDLTRTPAKQAEAWRVDYHHVKNIAVKAIEQVKRKDC